MAPAPDHAVRDGATLQVWADGVLVADLDDAAVIEVFLASLPADSRRQLVAAGELATDEPRLVAAHRAGLLSLGDKAVADRTGISMSWGRIKDRYRDR
jgi:hypothetical protein